MGKYRMYEPYGYIEENDYSSLRIKIDNEIAENRKVDNRQTEEAFTNASYNKELETVLFRNANGEIVGSLPMTEIIASDLVKEAKYDKDAQKLIIEFDNGDIVEIDLNDLINIQEAGDGLILVENKFAIKIADDSEDFLQVSSEGIKNVGIQDAINVERDRAISAETKEMNDRIADVDEEEARAISAETILNQLLNLEIQNRIADVDEEEARAISAETRLNAKLDAEITRSKDADDELDRRISILNDSITREITAREANDITIGNRISSEITARKAEAVNNGVYVKEDNKIYLKDINGNVLSEISTSDFVADGMIESVDIQTKSGGTYIVITWNTASGIETTELNIGDLFDADDYYTKNEIDNKFYNKTEINSSFTTVGNNINSETTARENGDAALDVRVTALNTALNGKANANDVYAKNEVYSKEESDAKFLTEHQDISMKADADSVYTKEEVDALIAEKENEIYNLTKIVGDIGGAVTYELPNPAGKSFNTLMSNNGTVKLTDDVTTGRFGPGITANNTVRLNLNNHDLTVTGLTPSSAQGAIMARGTQNITIGGKGTVDAGQGICIEGNGEETVINLTGSTTTYQTDRSGGELIYCYSGTINISNGIFKNLGENKTYMLNCYDANYRSGKANIIVTGGKFYDFNPADNSAEGEHTSFVPEGYHVETSTDGDSTVYTVKKDA